MTALVFTVAACGGTTTGTTGTAVECCHNPPEIVMVPARALAPNEAIIRNELGNCLFRNADGQTQPLAGCPDELPAPGRFWRSSAGECSVLLDVSCPPPSEATCNPPPPRITVCPAGSPDVSTYIGPSNPPAPSR
jgi:hypothetical protein